MTLWTVPQAFGESSWWPRQPTGSELLLMILISLNHGALGIVPWIYNAESTQEQMEASALFGRSLEVLTPYLTGKGAGRKVVQDGAVDVGTWKGEDGSLLVIVGNTGYDQVEWKVQLEDEWTEADLLFRNEESTVLVVGENGSVSGESESVGSGVWILRA